MATSPAVRPEAGESVQDDLPPPEGFWITFARQRLGLVGLAVVLLFCLLAALAPWIAPYDPKVPNAEAILTPPSGTHWLGTDQLGRDLLSQIIYGGRVSMTVGIASMLLGAIGGGFLGLLSGYVGKRLDNLIMRVMDALLAFPDLVLALVIAAILQRSLMNTIIAIGVVAIPTYARLVRGQVLQLKELEFMQAAQAMGAPRWFTIVHHVIPNVISIVIVQASISIAGAILSEAALSFLGLGVPPPTPTWGGILRKGYGMIEMAPWVSLASGAAIFVAVLGFNFLGDALRDTLDPKLRSGLR